MFNSGKLDYEIRIADGSQLYNYQNWKQPDAADFDLPYTPNRKNADRWHEAFLRQMAADLNPNAANYTFDFNGKLDLNDNPEPGENHDGLPYNPDVFKAFVTALFAAFFINCIFVLTAVCEEKKSKSFDFLRLMGASDGQIFFGHFLNHMLFWSCSFVLCIGYFAYFLSAPGQLPVKVTLILLLFGFLYLVHLIVFLFLLSAPFKRYLYPELLNVLLFYFCFKSFTELTYQTGFVAFLKLAHPLNVLIRFQQIGKLLCTKFDFKNDSLFKIFNYNGNGKDLSLTALFWCILFFILLECLLLDYIIQGILRI